ncbi:hypothetical protein VN97_g12577 [Penicillium thymicola]|uniref:Uncharacterized protein n=1 Tax=Penicillium thymicola TaxID=293382 RepID=A0AAI9T5Y7_PENTH|nr:hypothetical protein VN97_g12577 [Penicillium thymicola]
MISLSADLKKKSRSYCNQDKIVDRDGKEREREEIEKRERSEILGVIIIEQTILLNNLPCTHAYCLLQTEPFAICYLFATTEQCLDGFSRVYNSLHF